MTSDEFEIVTSCRLAHGLATDQTGNPLEGIVLHVDCINSVDGVAAGMTLFIFPEMAREIAQKLPVQLASLGDPLHTHTDEGEQQ